MRLSCCGYVSNWLYWTGNYILFARCDWREFSFFFLPPTSYPLSIHEDFVFQYSGNLSDQRGQYLLIILYFYPESGIAVWHSWMNFGIVFNWTLEKRSRFHPTMIAQVALEITQGLSFVCCPWMPALHLSKSILSTLWSHLNGSNESTVFFQYIWNGCS